MIKKKPAKKEVVASAGDITGHKETEDALRRSEEKYRQLLETASEVILVVQDLKIRFFNHRAVDFTGYSADELKDMPFANLVYPDDLEMVAGKHQRRLKGEPFENVYPFRYAIKGGRFGWAEISTKLVNWEGRPATLSVLSDITERKRIEEALRESEERFRRISENAPDVIYRYRLKPVPGFEYVSPAVVKLSGYTPEEFYADPLLARKIVHAEDKNKYIQHFSSLESFGMPLILRWMHKDGYAIWAEEIDVPVYNADRELIAYEGIFRDITERKRAEEALKESEQSYRLLAAYHMQLNDVSIAFAEASNTEDLFNRIAETFRLLTGAIATTFSVYNQEARALRVISLSIDPVSRDKVSSFFGPGLFEMQMPVSADVMEQMFSEVIRRLKDLYELSFGAMPQDISDAVMDAVGCRQIVALAITYAKELVGTCVAYLPADQPVVQDDALKTYAYIAGLAVKRRRSEEALRESDVQYRLLSEHMTDTVWLMDMDLKTTYQSPSVQRTRGFTPREIMEMPLEKHLTPESLKVATEVFLQEMAKLEADPDYNFTRTLELEFYRKDGGSFWSENTFSLIRDEGGRPISIMGEGRDITERKQVEGALKASEAKYRLLADNTVDGIWLLDMDLKLIYCSPSSEKQSGFTLQEIMEMSLEQYFTPESLKAVAEAFLEEMPKIEADPDYNPIITLDLEYYKKDGTTFWAESKFSAIRDKHGKPVSILAYARDITERKKAEEALQQSKKNYRLLAENTTDVVIIFDMNMQSTWISESVTSATGYTPEEYKNLPAEKRMTPGSVQKAVNYYIASLEREKAGISSPGQNEYLEIELYRKDGSTCWMENRSQFIRNSQGEAMNILMQGRDITARKNTEEALHKVENTYRMLAEHMSDTVWMTDMDLNITWLSPSGAKSRGYSLEEIIALPLDKQMTPESLGKLVRAFEKYARLEKEGRIPDPRGAISLDLEFCCKDGHTIVADCTFQNIRDEQGKVTGILAQARDITARKKVEEAVRESERRFKSIVEHISDIFFMLDANHELLYISPQVEQALGYTVEEVRKGWRKYLTDNPVNLEGHEKTQLAFITGEKQGPYLQEYMHRDGTKRLAEINESPLKNDKGEVIGIVGALRDITERNRIESALKESEEKYRMVVENAQEVIYIAVDGMLIFANKRTTAFSGYSLEELTSRPYVEFVHPDDRQSIAERYLQRLSGTEMPKKYSFRVICKSGDIKWVEVSMALVNWEGRPATLNFMTDITDRRRLEEEQQRVEKLESVGLLAGGIAHDFNNILTAILGNISLARMDTEPGSGLHDTLEQAEKASLRAKELTQQLLTFSKGGSPVRKLVSLDQLIRDTAGFVLRGSNVKCRFSIPADLWHAEIDAGQVSQVIHNLVINAQQAMPTGGTIEVKAENMALGETQSLGRGLPLKKGNYIRITVTDHGSGIPADHLDRIFDPFFTTKQKGSGLGLATSFSIARNHGGHLSVESVLGSGSAFYLYLPASTETSTIQQDIKEQIKSSGKVRVLVVDDEEAVRNIAGRLLKHIGYKDIEFAADGAEGVKIYQSAMESGRHFTLVILDLTIPGGMGGEAAIKELLKLDPGVRAIVSSGYADEAVMADYRKYGFSGMVAKPYTFEELRKAVQDVIG